MTWLNMSWHGQTIDCPTPSKSDLPIEFSKGTGCFVHSFRLQRPKLADEETLSCLPIRRVLPIPRLQDVKLCIPVEVVVALDEMFGAACVIHLTVQIFSLPQPLYWCPMSTEPVVKPHSTFTYIPFLTEFAVDSIYYVFSLAWTSSLDWMLFIVDLIFFFLL